MWSSLRAKRKDRIRGSDKSKKRRRNLVRILAAVMVLFLFPITSFASNSGNTGSGTSQHSGNVYTFSYDYDPNQDAIVLTVRTSYPIRTYGWHISHTYNYTDKTDVPSNNPKIAPGHTMADAMNQARVKWDISSWETKLGQPSMTVDGWISGYERGGDQNQIWYVKGNHKKILTFYQLPKNGFTPARTVVRQQSWTCTQDGYTQWSDGSYTDWVTHPGHIESSWQDAGADHYKHCTRNEHGCGHSILSRDSHHFGPWQDSGIDHYRVCKDCSHVERGNHTYNDWKDDPDRPGWQKHTCVDCEHPEWRDIEPPTVSVSASPTGNWTAGDVTVTIKAKDRGSGLSSVLLYRTNTLDKTTNCVKTYSFNGPTDEQTCSFTETSEGRFTYYAIASDQSNNKKQSGSTGEAMLDHSDPKQTVFIGGQSTRTETRQGTKKVYQPGAKKTVTETKDVPKVPVYEDATSQINGAEKAVKYNNITYELNGGEADGILPSEYIHGTETKIGNAKKTGYTFAGWIVTCDGQKLNSTPANDVIVGSKSTGDLAFSAQWSDVYGIKFDSGADDATGTMDPIPIGTIQKGQSYTLPKNGFSRTGYTFTGWNDQPDGSGKTYADGATVKDLVNQTGVYAALYAQWKPINYSISYNLGGGFVSGNPTTYNIETESFTLKNPTRTGYTFTGWTGSNGNTPQTSVTIPKGSYGDRSYTANWTINYYYVDVNNNIGTAAPGTFDVCVNGQPVANDVNDFYQKQPYNSHIQITDIKPQTGWDYNNGSNLDYYLPANDSATMLNFSKHTYTISYELDGGSISGQPTSYTYGSTTHIPQPSRSGYVFAGWTINGGSDRYANVTISSTYHENVSLSATWKGYESFSVNGTFAGGYYTVSSGHLTNNAYDLTTLTLFVGFNDRANHGELQAPTWNVGESASGDDWNNYTLYDRKHHYPNKGIPNFYGRYRWMYTTWGAYDYAIFLKYDSSRRLIATHVYYKGGSNIFTLPGGYMATPYTYFRDQDGFIFRTECTYVGDPVNMNPVAKNGYTFLGWSWENNGNITTSNVTRWNDGSYYAQWAKSSITLGN